MHVIVAVGLLLASASVLAKEPPGSRDLDVLPRFPQAQIVDFREIAFQERIYPQGSIRRISGRLRYEQEIDTQGQLTSVTYRLPDTHSSDQVFTAARESLQAQDAEVLYWCQGRECGSSSLWANAVFGQSTLYGPDDQQAYALMRLAEPRENNLLALYSITRGNRRAYLHAELLEATAPLGEVLPTPATLLRQLKSSGELRLPKSVKLTPERTKLMARSLNQDSILRVSLSGAQAQDWREALIEQGVRAARLELGPTDEPGMRLQVLP
jgi:hypothetical protein